MCVCGFHVHITSTYIYVRLKGRSKSGSNLGSWERRSIVIPWILLWSKKLSKIDKVLWAYHKFFEAADINSSYFEKVRRNYDYWDVSTSVLQKLENRGKSAWMFPTHLPSYYFDSSQPFRMHAYWVMTGKNSYKWGKMYLTVNE